MAIVATVAFYATFVGWLVLAGRGDDARALARFVPACALLCPRLLSDPRVPRRSKLLLLALIAYLAMPIDLVPDFIPIVGYLDDAVIVAIVLRNVLHAAGRPLLEEHWTGSRWSLDILIRLAYGSSAG